MSYLFQSINKRGFISVHVDLLTGGNAGKLLPHSNTVSITSRKKSLRGKAARSGNYKSIASCLCGSDDESRNLLITLGRNYVIRRGVINTHRHKAYTVCQAKRAGWRIVNSEIANTYLKFSRILNIVFTVEINSELINILNAKTAWPPIERSAHVNASLPSGKSTVINLTCAGNKGCYRLNRIGIAQGFKMNMDSRKIFSQALGQRYIINNSIVEFKQLYLARYTCIKGGNTVLALNLMKHLAVTGLGRKHQSQIIFSNAANSLNIQRPRLVRIICAGELFIVEINIASTVKPIEAQINIFSFNVRIGHMEGRCKFAGGIKISIIGHSLRLINGRGIESPFLQS